MRLLVLLVAFVALPIAQSVCHAQSDVADVSLTIDECVDVDHSLVQRVAMLELQSPAGEPAQASTRVAVRCEAALILVHIEDTVTGKTLERRIDLNREPAGARARVLGLAVAESVHASWVELTIQDRAPAVYVDAAASTAVRENTRVAVAAVADDAAQIPSRHLWLGGSVLTFAGSFVPLFGVDFGASVDLNQHLALSLGGVFGQGQTSTLARSVVVSVAMFRPGIRVFDRFGPYELALEGGFMLGTLPLSPELQSGDVSRGTTVAFLWGGQLAASTLVHLAYGLRLGAKLELGANAHQFEGTLGTASVVVGHVWLGVALGLEYSF